MMNKEMFKKEIEKMGTVKMVTKSYGQEKVLEIELSCEESASGSCIKAVITVDALYEKYLSSQNMEDVSAFIEDIKNRKPEFAQNLGTLVSPEYILNNAIIDFADMGMKENLPDVYVIPTEYENIFGYYRVICDEHEEDVSSYALKAELIPNDDIFRMKLKKKAVENMSKRGIVFSGMSMMLTIFHKPDITADNLEDFQSKLSQLDTSAPEMYVFTNKNSSGMLIFVSEEIRNMLYDRFGGFFILPSSRHEVLIVPNDTPEDCIQKFKNMVREVNSDKKLVSNSEFFTDTVFYYDGKNLKEF